MHFVVLQLQTVGDTEEEKGKNEVRSFSTTSSAKSSFQLEKKTQEVVEDHLGKFRLSLGKYLAGQEKGKGSSIGKEENNSS